MSKYKLSNNILIILTALFILIQSSSNQNANYFMNNDDTDNFYNMKEEEGEYFDEKDFYPGPGSDKPPDDHDLMEEINAARQKKDEAEIECQQKKIYVIALGILSGVFLLLIIIYCIFKCYMFFLARKEQNTPFRRIRISKLGEVYLEENFDLNKNDISENNNSKNINANNNDRNEAPSCFNVSQRNTFNPDNCDENNNYYKPYKIDDN